MYKKKIISLILCLTLCLNVITPATAEIIDGDEAVIQVTAITDSSTIDCDIDADNTLPSPFNVGHPDNMVMIALKGNNQSKYTTAYCIEFGKKATDDDELTAKYDNLYAGVRRIVNYALLEGFYKEFSESDFDAYGNIKLSSLTNNELRQYYAAQVLIWIATEGYFYNDTERTKIENAFFRSDKYLNKDRSITMASCKEYYEHYYNKVKYNFEAPSFAAQSTDLYSLMNLSSNSHAKHKLIYNSTTKKYEITLTNINKDSIAFSTTTHNYSAFKNCSFTTAQLNDLVDKGITVTRSDDKETITITSNKAITEGQVIIIYGGTSTAMQSKIAVWENASDAQSVASLDYTVDLDPLKYGIALYTEDEAGLDIIKTNPKGIVSGFTFKVEKQNGNSWDNLGTYTTNAVGKINIDNLADGTYRVTEVLTTAQAQEYVTPASQTVTIKGTETGTVTFANVPKEARVSVEKEIVPDGIGNPGDTNMSGIVFGIYTKNSSDEYVAVKDKNGNVVRMTTNAAGKATSAYFYYNSGVDYYIHEISVPTSTGLNHNDNYYSLTNAQLTGSSTYQYSMSKTYPNWPMKGKVEIIKKLEKDATQTVDVNASGIIFELSLNSNPQMKYTQTTDSSGKATFTMIPYGVYTLKEVASSVPNSHLTIPNITVTVDEAGATYTYQKTDPIKRGNVSLVKKLELTTTEKLNLTDKYAEGVRFYASPIDVDGNVLTDIKIYCTEPTDESGYTIIENLEYGKWMVYEDEATIPEGYLAIEPFEVDITENDKTYEVGIKTDLLERGNVSLIKKLELTTAEKLNPTDKYAEGVKFYASPIDVDGNVASDIKVYCTAPTDANGYAIIENLEYGKWMIYEDETTVPEGYLAIEPFEVNITENGKTYEVGEKTDLLKRGHVSIIKKLELTTTEKLNPTDKYAEGVSFYASPIDTDGNVAADIKVYCTAPTDKNGYTIIENLEYGKWMIYEDEATVPEGYLAIEPFEVNITENGKTYKVGEKIDTIIKASLQIYKISGTTKLPVSNTKFALYESGTDVYIGEYATDSNGYIEINDITYGKYYLIETETDFRFELKEEKIVFEISSTDTVELIVENTGRVGTVDGEIKSEDDSDIYSYTDIIGEDIPLGDEIIPEENPYENHYDEVPQTADDFAVWRVIVMALGSFTIMLLTRKREYKYEK